MSREGKHPLVIVAGKPGVGKSTYGAELAKKTGSVLIDLDTLSEPIVKAGLALAGHDPEDRDSAQYKAHFREPVYRAMFDLANENVSHLPVVLVGPFTKELEDDMWDKRLATQFQTQVEVHYVTCSEAQRYDRIKARNHPRDAGKLHSWQAHQDYYPDSALPACKFKLIET